MSNSKVTDSLISEKYFYGVSPNAKRHLLSSLANLREGAPTTPSFKLYGKSDWSVVTDFLTQISAHMKVPAWLLEYEYSRVEKFGPQGGHAPWDELKENAEMYFSRVSDVSNFSCETAKYRNLQLKMLGVHESLNTLKSDGRVQTRAAGWRAFNLKKTDVEAQDMAIADLKSGNWKNGWAYFFSRFNKMKKRLFIPMPFSNMIGQAQYFTPFLRAIQEDLRRNLSKSSFRFWGDKIGFGPLFHQILEPLLRGLDSRHLVYVMRDFDKMDTTTGPSQKSAYFLPKLAAAFNLSEHSASYQKMSDMILFSNRCPIATPDGMWTGDHGEASGATVTNGGETCCNEEYNNQFQDNLEDKCHGTIEYTEIFSAGNGDDGISIYYLNDLNKFDEFAELIRESATEAADATGFIIQAEKWDIHLSTYGKYCQYLVDWDGSLLRAMYPASLILNSIVNPEKEYSPSEWDKDYRDIDVIMKLSNGRELPYFHELIDYVDNGMKYRLLGRSEEASRRILSKYDKYISLQPSAFQFNLWGDEGSGLENNPVVLYLLRKRGW